MWQCSDDIETHIVPIIMHLAQPDSLDDFRADAVLVSISFIFPSKPDMRLVANSS